MRHELKCWPVPFRAVLDGSKRFEIRKFDRYYQQGDEVNLLEFDPETETYTGRAWAGEIGFVVLPGQWNLPPDIGVFSLVDVIAPCAPSVR